MGRVKTFLLSIIKIEVDYVTEKLGEPSFVFDGPSISYITANGPLGGGVVLTIQGNNFGTSPIGFDLKDCIRYRNPDIPDLTQCMPGDSGLF